MAATATKTFIGQGLSPALYPESAKTDAVKLSPGTYAQGTVLGQKSTLTAANEVQTITFTGVPTGGTFRLQFVDQVTAPINYDPVAANLATNIANALLALANIGTGNVTVAAGGGAPVVTFTGALAAKDLPLLLNYTNNLTGGTTPNFTIAETSPGRAAGGSWKAYDDSLSDGSNVAKVVLIYATVVDTFGNHICGGGDVGAGTGQTAPVYIGGYFRTADLVGIDTAGVTDLGRIVRGSATNLTDPGTILQIN